MEPLNGCYWQALPKRRSLGRTPREAGAAVRWLFMLFRALTRIASMPANGVKPVLADGSRPMVGGFFPGFPLDRFHAGEAGWIGVVAMIKDMQNDMQKGMKTKTRSRRSRAPQSSRGRP